MVTHFTKEDEALNSGPTVVFAPRDRQECPSSLESSSGEQWQTILDSPCAFAPKHFLTVMLNMIENPNVTSPHLFRADVLSDSEGTIGPDRPEEASQSVDYQLPGLKLRRTIVRELIPRNAQLDRALVQTCHFYSSTEDEERQRNVIVYIPHVDSADQIPYYHPAVAKVGFEHFWHPKARSDHDAEGTISISYSLFPGTGLSSKLERVALRLLQTIHKHGHGEATGYEKRVHLDQVIPQKRYQDTYARLKAKHGRHLSETWVEVTDPGKHVFEDLGIAAFLIELWRDWYGVKPEDERKEFCEIDGTRSSSPGFPGFVDIGCGNGVLVYILLMEGYDGWGFDARERKTWSIFPEHVQQRLERRILIPEVFDGEGTDCLAGMSLSKHNGVFEPGTFIISNHADELTAWTPLLAHLSVSDFIAIPCCSHDLSGSRFRAPSSVNRVQPPVARLPQQEKDSEDAGPEQYGDMRKKQAAETGSLKKTEGHKKMPSAYSTLCSYVASLAEELDFQVEKEILRIPSTRNTSMLGRQKQRLSSSAVPQHLDKRGEDVVAVVERELGRPVGVVGIEWRSRAANLAKKPGSGH